MSDEPTTPDQTPDDEPSPEEDDDPKVVSESTRTRKEADDPSEGKFEGDPNTYPDPENPTRTP